MGWWIAFAILTGLAILPLGIRIRYDAQGAYMAILAGPVRIQLLPKREKKLRRKKDKPVEPIPEMPKSVPEPEPKPEPKPKAATPAEKYPNLEKQPRVTKKIPAPSESTQAEGGSWKEFLSLVPIVWDFLGNFRRKLRVNRLEFRLVLAGGDPCDLAVNYGRVWAAVGNFMPHLERAFVIQKRDVKVECDFSASKTTVTARMDVTITLGRLLAVTITFAFRGLKEYLKITKKRKGGAVT